ncbi:hypothetical protein LCGC14_1251590 [marine sediment metagenome]|uniref:Uncharacterized protein n=1 Tax=marine sediment metagenome TaxID=412755 RepID=A0A0F9L2Y3_9ZZZZ
MIKYNAFVQVKEGSKFSSINALYLSQFGIHAEDYVKTAFLVEDSKIKGSLSQYSKDNAKEWKKVFDSVWDKTNIFPVYVFSNADDFLKTFLTFFNDIDSLNKLT